MPVRVAGKNKTADGCVLTSILHHALATQPNMVPISSRAPRIGASYPTRQHAIDMYMVHVSSHLKSGAGFESRAED